MRRDCPWAEAEARDRVEVAFAPLPDACGGAVLQRRPGADWILLDPALSPVEQRCRLAHELVHLDRGSSVRCRWSPRSMDVLVVREELRVDREVADWLVPTRELAPLIRQLVRSGCGVDVPIVCEEFLVTPQIAAIALEREARLGLRRSA